MHRGIPQNDLGIRTDILNNIKKNIGIKMLIRSMAPKVVIADEIGAQEDIEAIQYALCSGVKGIFTAHGANMQDIYNNPILKELLETNLIQRIILLDNRMERGRIKSIYELKEKKYIKLEWLYVKYKNYHL